MHVSTDLIGATLPGASYRWGPDEAIVYALGVGARPPAELHLLDEAHGPVVLPTFALIANWWAVKDVRAVLGPGDAAMVHASQSLRLLRPIPPEGEVQVDARVAAVWDKGKSSIVEVAATGHDRGGALFETRSATMILGVGGWGGERGPSAATDEQAGAPVAVHDDHVALEQAAIYRLSGDRNRLHIDPGAARAAGFDDVFLHGLCTLGFAARALITTVGGGRVASLRAIGCRFASPVHGGRPLRTEVWDGPEGTCSFRTTQDGTPALSAGWARFER